MWPEVKNITVAQRFRTWKFILLAFFAIDVMLFLNLTDVKAATNFRP